MEEFVKNTVERILNEKNQTHAGVTLREVMEEVTQAVKHCMNQLAQSDEYQLHYTVNKIPFLTRNRKQDEN